MNSYTLYVATLAVISCLLALGAYVTLSAGLMVVCFGAIMSLGGIVAAVMVSNGVPYPVSLLIGGFSGAVAGALVYFTCSHLLRFLFAVGTLGFGELARVVAINTSSLGGALGYKSVTMAAPVACTFAILLLAMVSFFFFERSPIRSAFRLIKEDDVSAASIGIDVHSHRLAAMVISSFLVGLAGGLYIHAVGLLEPRMFGFENSVQILMFAIVGGTATSVGPVLAGVSLTILPELLRFSTSLRMLIYGAVLVAVMVFRPEGIVTRSSRRRQVVGPESELPPASTF
jgi:branched-chain amino acid transport system permease protein